MTSFVSRLQLRHAKCSGRSGRIVRACATDAAAYEYCARQLYEQAWSQGNVEVLDEIMAEAHTQRDMIWSTSSGDGRAAMQSGVTGFRRYYPDLKFTVKNVVPDPTQNTCFVEWMAEGTYSGVIDGVDATGEKEAFGGVSVLTIENNQIVESRVYRDSPKGEKKMFMRNMDQ